MTSEDLKKLTGTDERLRAIADTTWWWGLESEAWRCEVEGVQWKLDGTTLERSEGCLDLACDACDLDQAAQVARAMDAAVGAFNRQMAHPARDELPNIPVVFRVPWCACYKSGDVMGYDAASGRYTCPHCGAKAMSGAEARVEMIALRAELAAKDAQLMAASDVLIQEGRVNEALRCRNAVAPGAAERLEALERERKATMAQVSESLNAKNAEIARLNGRLVAHLLKASIVWVSVDERLPIENDPKNPEERLWAWDTDGCVLCTTTDDALKGYHDMPTHWAEKPLAPMQTATTREVSEVNRLRATVDDLEAGVAAGLRAARTVRDLTQALLEVGRLCGAGENESPVEACRRLAATPRAGMVEDNGMSFPRVPLDKFGEKE